MKHERKTAAVILSAGSGTRMGGVAKQQKLILGKSVLFHTVHAFDMSSVIDEIILVVRQEDMILAQTVARECCTPVRIVLGGEDRQQSSRIGVDSVGEDCVFVAIHDGARCLVTPQIIEKTVIKAWQTDAACAAGVVVDTVKEMTADATVVRTVPREQLALAQTPQVIRRSLYQRAVEHAEAHSLRVTDDCGLLEALGHPIALVLHTEVNDKITYPKDLFLAEYIMKERRGAL